MAANSLQELFLEELRDTYDGEKRLTKALPKLARAATSSALQQASTSHLRETERQITRLEQVFRALGEKPRGKTCEGIKGIVEEGSQAIQDYCANPPPEAGSLGCVPRAARGSSIGARSIRSRCFAATACSSTVPRGSVSNRRRAACPPRLPRCGPRLSPLSRHAPATRSMPSC